MSKSMLSNRQLWSVVQQEDKIEADGNTLTVTCLFQGSQCQLHSPKLPTINSLLLHCHMPPSDLMLNHSCRTINSEWQLQHFTRVLFENVPGSNTGRGNSYRHSMKQSLNSECTFSCRPPRTKKQNKQKKPLVFELSKFCFPLFVHMKLKY